MRVEFAGEIQVIIFGQPDSDGPRVCNVMTVHSVGVETAAEFESNFIEAELAVSMFEDFPALIWCNGRSQVVTERAELELGVQAATKGSSENNPAGHSELRVSEVLDANPSSSAEENDDRSSRTLMHEGLKQRESRAEPTDCIYKNDNPAGRETAGQKLVVDVAAVGAEDGLASEETAGDGEAGVQKWDRECDQGGGHAQNGGGFLAPENAVAAQKKADQEAARVAQKNGSRIEVEAQKAQEGSSERNGRNGEWNVVLEEGGNQDGGCCEQTNAGGKAVHSIDEVEGICTADQPEYGNRDCAPGWEVVTGDAINLDASPNCGAGSGQLADEFLPWFEAEEIINDTCKKN